MTKQYTRAMSNINFDSKRASKLASASYNYFVVEFIYNKVLK